MKTPRWRFPGVNAAAKDAVHWWHRDRHWLAPMHHGCHLHLWYSKVGEYHADLPCMNEKIHTFAEDHTWPSLNVVATSLFAS